MKQKTSISSELEAEHQWIDQCLEQFQRGLASWDAIPGPFGDLAPGPFREAASALRRHIYLEEEVLFPLLKARGFEDPVAVMIYEHGEICRFLDGIHCLIRRQVAPRRIRDALTALRALLEEHNFKEERVLYPAADQLLDESGIAEVLQKLKEAQPWEGWSCRAHRGGYG